MSRRWGAGTVRGCYTRLLLLPTDVHACMRTEQRGIIVASPWKGYEAACCRKYMLYSTSVLLPLWALHSVMDIPINYETLLNGRDENMKTQRLLLRS